MTEKCVPAISARILHVGLHPSCKYIKIEQVLHLYTLNHFSGLITYIKFRRYVWLDG